MSRHDPLVMTEDDMLEAYGPNGPDREDIEIWREACRRDCDHDDAYDYMAAQRLTSCHCPNCGIEVEQLTAEEREIYEDRQHDAYMRSISPGGQW